MRMVGWMMTGVMAAFVLVATADAEVLCVRAKKNGTLSGAIKVRQQCKKREVQVDAPMLGLCCDFATTTTVVSATTLTTPVTSFTTLTTTVTSFTTLTTTVTSFTTLTTSVTTFTTTSLVCPTFTTTTIGISFCGGNPPTCFGLCPNARACINDGIACACVGTLLDCGVVASDGTCGGVCPPGMLCEAAEMIGMDGCPESLACACVVP